MALGFSPKIFDRFSNINFMTVRQVTAELCHAGGQTDPRPAGCTDRRTHGPQDARTDGPTARRMHGQTPRIQQTLSAILWKASNKIRTSMPPNGIRAHDPSNLATTDRPITKCNDRDSPRTWLLERAGLKMNGQRGNWRKIHRGASLYTLFTI